MATIANLSASLTVRTSQFTKGFKKAGQIIDSFTRRGALAGAAFTGLTLHAFKSMDAIHKTSQRLGVATEKLVGLRMAAELSGVGVKTLEMGLQRMTRRVAEAGVGMGEARGALKELGLNAKSMAKLSMDKQFLKIADAMKAVKNQGDRVRLTQKLFDSEGVQLVNTLQEGSEWLLAVERNAIRVGAAFSSSKMRSITNFNNAMTRLKFIGKGFMRKWAITVSERLGDWGKSVAKVLVSIKGMAAGVFNLAKNWGKFAIGFAVFLKVAPMVVSFINQTTKAVKGLAAANAAATGAKGLIGAVGLGVGALAAAGSIYAIDKFVAPAAEPLGALGSQAGEGIDEVIRLLQNIDRGIGDVNTL